MVKEDREKKLPLWAQKKLEDMRARIHDLERMREAHSVLHDREWFTIRGPGPFDDDKEVRKLFFLYSDQAHPVCSLYKNDILLVGRSLERHPEAKAAL